MSINSPGEQIHAGTHGTIRTHDQSDGSMEVEFSGHTTTQWVRESDLVKLQPDDEVQVSPTENFLGDEYSGWTFVEGRALCCGVMPRLIENMLIRCIFQHRCAKLRDDTSWAGGSDTNRSLELTSIGTDGGEGASSVTRHASDYPDLRDDPADELKRQMRWLERQMQALQTGGEAGDRQAVTLGKSRGRKQLLGASDTMVFGGMGRSGIDVEQTVPNTFPDLDVEFTKGTRVRVTTGKNEGQLGILTKYIQKKGKWGVKLDNGARIAVRSADMAAEEQP